MPLIKLDLIRVNDLIWIIKPHHIGHEPVKVIPLLEQCFSMRLRGCKDGFWRWHPGGIIGVMLQEKIAIRIRVFWRELSRQFVPWFYATRKMNQKRITGFDHETKAARIHPIPGNRQF